MSAAKASASEGREIAHNGAYKRTRTQRRSGSKKPGATQDDYDRLTGEIIRLIN